MAAVAADTSSSLRHSFSNSPESDLRAILDRPVQGQAMGPLCGTTSRRTSVSPTGVDWPHDENVRLSAAFSRT